MRVALAGVLFSAPDLLLLDEPTNYLDLEGALWLESYLARYPHTVIVIFPRPGGLLNRAEVGSILHLRGQEAHPLQRALRHFRGHPHGPARRGRGRKGASRKRAGRICKASSTGFRYSASKARQAQSRLKMIEKDVRRSPCPPRPALRRFTFPEPEQLSPPIIAAESVSVGYNDTPVLGKLTFRIRPGRPDRASGSERRGEKSTFSKLLADKLEPMGGRVTRARKLKVGVFRAAPA